MRPILSAAIVTILGCIQLHIIYKTLYVGIVMLINLLKLIAHIITIDYLKT